MAKGEESSEGEGVASLLLFLCVLWTKKEESSEGEGVASLLLVLCVL